jgi:Lanthionine-containing peptide SapB precursor RamS
MSVLDLQDLPIEHEGGYSAGPWSNLSVVMCKSAACSTLSVIMCY